ncbi:MAG: zinc ribbon domain-containing protein [Firmicutes bacterium]|nr:zinc ribbon domain-containing protein [Bacillota bacterium]
MTRKKAINIRNVLLIAGLFIILLGYIWAPLGIVGIVVTVSSLIPHFLYNKCPHCGKQLERNEEDFCQFCGKPLNN